MRAEVTPENKVRIPKQGNAPMLLLEFIAENNHIQIKEIKEVTRKENSFFEIELPTNQKANHYLANYINNNL